MILSAALNISVSLILVRFWGVAGVQFGTLAAFLPISYGRSRFIVRGYFGKSLAKYIVRHMLRAVLAAGEGAVCWFLTKELPVSVSGILLRFVVWALVPLAVNLPIFWRDQSFKDLCGYLAKVFLIMKTKLKGNRERNGGD